VCRELWWERRPFLLRYWGGGGPLGGLTERSWDLTRDPNVAGGQTKRNTRYYKKKKRALMWAWELGIKKKKGRG